MSQPNWKLIFSGTAQDELVREVKTRARVIRQIGQGTLAIIQTNADGSQETIAEYDALSGPQINGLLPDAHYHALPPVASNFLTEGEHPDKKGNEPTRLGYKMPLSYVADEDNVKRPFKRFALLIHPVPGTEWVQKKYFPNNWTEGCIGLIGHAANEDFYKRMKDYFKKTKRKHIPLEVDVESNANVRTQLGAREHYA
ncbi:hypothetical protein V9K67_03275 [Paraflavisolibacter sp. H34]|uniref:hypothetical protein n=1 Tax=Huijunlia imazamoxiresistens TaxID=3127457 RepID=UPI00301B5D2C